MKAKIQDKIATERSESASQPTTPGKVASEEVAVVEASTELSATMDVDAVMSDAAPADPSAPSVAVEAPLTVEAPPTVSTARAVVAPSPRWHSSLRELISDMSTVLPESALETIGFVLRSLAHFSHFRLLTVFSRLIARPSTSPTGP